MDAPGIMGINQLLYNYCPHCGGLANYFGRVRACVRACVRGAACALLARVLILVALFLLHVSLDIVHILLYITDLFYILTSCI